MKLLLLISAMLIINGCSWNDPEPCSPVPCVKVFPKLPVYKIPTPKKMTEPAPLGGGMYAVVGSELRDCLATNVEIRRICTRANIIHKEINNVYQKGK